jgi:drug/metabolite transporter (DMT)-like permease
LKRHGAIIQGVRAFSVACAQDAGTDNSAMSVSVSPWALSERHKGLLAAVVTVLVWTSFIVISRVAVDPALGSTLNSFDIAYCRMVGAALILLPWGWFMVRQDRARGLGAASWLGLSPLPVGVTLILGLIGGFLYAQLAYGGFMFAPALHASVLLPGSLPLWTALLARWWLREHLTRVRVIGLGLIVLGDLLVGGASLLQAFDGGRVWLGDVLFVLGSFCWACYSVLARQYRVEAVRATIAITVFAFVTYVPTYTLLAYLQWVPAKVLVAPWPEVLRQVTFQGWGTVVISGITFTQMIRHYGPVRSTMITALVPGLSAMGAVLLLGEPLRWNLMLGLVLVTAGILFGVRAASARGAGDAGSPVPSKEAA